MKRWVTFTTAYTTPLAIGDFRFNVLLRRSKRLRSNFVRKQLAKVNHIQLPYKLQVGSLDRKRNIVEGMSEIVISLWA